MSGLIRRMSRRDALKLGILGGAAIALPATLKRQRALSHDLAPKKIQALSPLSTPFQVPLPVPGVLSPTITPTADLYTITMKEAQVQILPGLATTIWGYNGLFPGPTIRARLGRPVIVTQVNHLPVETVIHLHGGHVAPADDGFPNDVILPGASRDYHYPNSPYCQRGGTQWYHDHTMDFTGRNVYMGLAGFYILEDDYELNLQNNHLLPSGLAGTVPAVDAHEIPLVIQDRLFHPDGSLFYTGSADGVVGDTILVNGGIQPFFQVAARKYRLRILNGSNARVYELALSTGQPFVQIGTEGGLLPRPVSRASIPIVPAERVDLVVDFFGYGVGNQIILRNLLGEGSTAEIMRFDVVRAEVDDVGTIPDPLRPLQPQEILLESEAVKTREFRFDRSGGSWTINGKLFDPDRNDATPTLNTVEIWHVFNSSGGWTHPFHMHDEHFQILERNGAPPADYEIGWRETANLGHGESLRIIMKFTDFTGRYVFHCHNTEHEDARMMGVFSVLGHKVYFPQVQSGP